MLFSQADLRRIVAGDLDLAFRRWRRPRHVLGGRQRTPVGVVEFTSIDRIEETALTEADAARAGTDLTRLRALLARKEGDLYRIGLRYAGQDERAVLREQVPDEAGIDALLDTLAAIDRRSRHGPWTERHLTLIGERPGVLAEHLATSIGREKRAFKADVRRLKELGLTESLPVGYRLSPRGEAVLARFRSSPTDQSG
ncbi:hypothetical protein [Nocardioides insulae]|uniref:hypothetical protein n=1 Tax=Nocardioides insulae TaxID=394734 RepID=UPI000411839B|nr:hypothetical protein [Nocardioides insulae]